jgi:hypothetical protein
MLEGAAPVVPAGPDGNWTTPTGAIALNPAPEAPKARTNEALIIGTPPPPDVGPNAIAGGGGLYGIVGAMIATCAIPAPDTQTPPATIEHSKFRRLVLMGLGQN